MSEIEEAFYQKKPVIHDGKPTKILMLRYTPEGKIFALTTAKPQFGDWTRLEDLSLVNA